MKHGQGGRIAAGRSGRGAAVAVLLAAVLASCAPVVRNHGYTPSPEALAQIEAGVDTRGSVRRKIGRPGSTGAFDEQGWYYVSTIVEHETYKDPKVVERKVVAVTFDGSDVVTGVNTYGLEDGRVIDLRTRTTPTYGRQLTFLEQLIGNIGAVGGEDFFGDN